MTFRLCRLRRTWNVSRSLRFLVRGRRDGFWFFHQQRQASNLGPFIFGGDQVYDDTGLADRQPKRTGFVADTKFARNTQRGHIRVANEHRQTTVALAQRTISVQFESRITRDRSLRGEV